MLGDFDVAERRFSEDKSTTFFKKAALDCGNI